jgi:hypothetical protein
MSINSILTCTYVHMYVHVYYDHTYVYVHRPQQQQHHCKRAAGDSPLVAQLAEARKKKRATEIVAENQRDGGFVAATEKLVPSPWTSHPAYGRRFHDG